MAVDMKETITRAALTLLMDRHIKKLTVKDIVEQCHITRQAFYYHFEDIPALFHWMLEKKTDQILQQTLAQDSDEDGLHCLFEIALDLMPYIKRSMDSNYRAETETLLRQYMQRFFVAVVEKRNYYPQCSLAEIKWIVRYHSLAILGLLQEWTEQDTKQLDMIVHTVYRLMTEGIPPQGPK